MGAVVSHRGGEDVDEPCRVLGRKLGSTWRSRESAGEEPSDRAQQEGEGGGTAGGGDEMQQRTHPRGWRPGDGTLPFTCEQL